MPKFRVRVYSVHYLSATIDVEAEDEDKAVDKVYEMADSNLDSFPWEGDEIDDFEVGDVEELE